jgi:hypothetical protein
MLDMKERQKFNRIFVLFLLLIYYVQNIGGAGDDPHDIKGSESQTGDSQHSGESVPYQQQPTAYQYPYYQPVYQYPYYQLVYPYAYYQPVYPYPYLPQTVPLETYYPYQPSDVQNPYQQGESSYYQSDPNYQQFNTTFQNVSTQQHPAPVPHPQVPYYPQHNYGASSSSYHTNSEEK